MHLGSRLSKEAANFAGEGDTVLVLERADRVDENLKDWDLVEKSKKIITKYWNVRIVSMKTWNIKTFSNKLQKIGAYV